MSTSGDSRQTELETWNQALRSTLGYVRAHDYAGYNKHDALNSPFLAALLGHTKWTRIAAIQAVMRAPWNVRPVLGVPRTRNPKGLGLWAHALLDAHVATGLRQDLDEARKLLDWLLDNPAQGFRGLCWGYPYPWQDLGFLAPRDFPNRVVTCWIGFAFVEAARQTGDPVYRDALARIAEFLTGEPNVLHDDPEMKCYSYVPDASVTWAVMDVPALVGAFLAEAADVLDLQDYRDEARRLLNWVADKQTPYGAWFYTYPAEDSFITHDNYHTAIILDCFDRYRVATGDDRFDQAYWDGLEYYRQHLFTVDGAPRWMNHKEYPYDIHGAGSGILCFVRAASRDPRYADSARKAIDWALRYMYDRRGFFYYQRTRFYTKRFCLLRWCNGWMCWALASAIRGLSGSFGERLGADSES